jgi:hypothetical protein
MADADGLGFNGDPKFSKTQTQRKDFLSDSHKSCEKLADADGARLGKYWEKRKFQTEFTSDRVSGFDPFGPHEWPPGPEDVEGWRDWIGQGLCSPVVRRGVDGFPRGMDVRSRLRALGNAVCPQQGAEAFRQLMDRAGFGKVEA